MISQIELARLTMHFSQNLSGNALPQLAEPNGKAADFLLSGRRVLSPPHERQSAAIYAGQPGELQAWTDMVTLQLYPTARDVEALAATACAVLDNYKAGKGIVVKTAEASHTCSKSSENPGQHLIVAIFGDPELIEVAFSRFKMHECFGSAAIYSHRILPEKDRRRGGGVADRESPLIECNLMNWSATSHSSSSSTDSQ